MKNIIKLEEMAMLVASILALIYFKVEWWYYLILFLGPDISMIGYLAGNKVGAICYNIFHHKGIALVVFVIGFSNGNWLLQVVGLILFGHSSMDRVLGYGLKYNEGFKFTHLGAIGKKD
ncbi:MAG: DUF4260 domain-containing protein [Ferruginibacter sp.]